MKVGNKLRSYLENEAMIFWENCIDKHDVTVFVVSAAPSLRNVDNYYD